MRSTEFFAKALDGTLTARDLTALLGTKPREDQLLEFKSGQWLNQTPGKQSKAGDPIDPAGKLRKWMAAFANAEGGALVIGVCDPDSATPWHVDGCPAQKPDNQQWVSRVLRDFVASLPTPVRTHEINVNGLTVLVVAVPRAVNLIACIEHGQQVHYLRIGEETLTMSGSLLADLTLGRRQRPFIELDVHFAPRGGGDQDDRVTLDVVVHNHGLSVVDSYVLGAVSIDPMQTAVAPSLRRYVEIIEDLAGLGWGHRMELENGPRLAPFQRGSHQVRVRAPSSQTHVAVVRAIVFLAAEHALPVLAQVQFAFLWGHVSEPSVEILSASTRGDVSIVTTPALR